MDVGWTVCRNLFLVGLAVGYMAYAISISSAKACSHGSRPHGTLPVRWTSTTAVRLNSLFIRTDGWVGGSEDKDGWRTIRISDADPDQRAALEQLGFAPDTSQRYPPGTRYFDRAVANLRRAVEEMDRHNIAATPVGWSPPFRDLLSRAERARIPLAVIGSVALAIRGVDVRPGDIDVLTTPEGADALADCYQDVLIVPLATTPGFGRFGRAFTGSIRVEWLGNPARIQQGPWPLAAAAWSIASPFEEICWENRLLRVPPLEVQRRVEIHRQRPDRAAAIDNYRRTHWQEL